MNRRHELRKRRQERIQHILKRDEDGAGLYGRHRPERIHEVEHESRLREDPEYQWYQKADPWKEYADSGPRQTIRIQLLVSAVLFAAVWAMFQWNHPVASRGQTFVITSLTEEIQLDAVSAWYRERFGQTPAFIPALHRSTSESRSADAEVSRAYVAPVSGSVIEPFGGVRSGAGVVIRTNENVALSMDTGLVLFSGETPDTGATVIVRHPGGVQSVYGFLGSAAVQKDQWVEAGEQIGHLKPVDQRNEGGLLYFAVKKGNSFIDPADVVPLL